VVGSQARNFCRDGGARLIFVRQRGHEEPVERLALFSREFVRRIRVIVAARDAVRRPATVGTQFA
jgi:hypothetical protein